MTENLYRKFFTLGSGHRETAVLKALLDARPAGVSLADLFTDSVEPERQAYIARPSPLMRVMISKLRHKLEEHGWTITWERTNESGRPWYRMETIDERRLRQAARPNHKDRSPSPVPEDLPIPTGPGAQPGAETGES